MQDAPQSPEPRLVVRFDVEIQLIEWPRQRVGTLAASVPLALEACLALGVKAHFFVGRGALALLPALVERILAEGHDLDLLLGPHDEPDEAWEEAVSLLRDHEHNLRGVAGPARPHQAVFALPALSAPPSGIHVFPGPPEVIARNLTRYSEKPEHWPDWEAAIRTKIESGYRIRTMREILHESL
jgi:hypothetical protein